MAAISDVVVMGVRKETDSLGPELIVEATMISQMILTSAFSDGTEFSVSTGGLL